MLVRTQQILELQGFTKLSDRTWYKGNCYAEIENEVYPSDLPVEEQTFVIRYYNV